MTDDVDNTESAESEPQGPRGGERLAEARRERQIAVIEIAKELHLDEHKVRALERNEFDLHIFQALKYAKKTAAKTIKKATNFLFLIKFFI